MKNGCPLLSCEYSTGETPCERHFHNSYELVYVCAGRARFRLGAAEYDAKPHSLLFIGKFEEHSVKTADGYRRYSVRVSPAQLDRLLDEPGLKAVFVSRSPRFCHCFDLTPAAERVEFLFSRMAEEYRNPSVFCDTYLSALFREMMVLCYRLCGEQFPRPSRPVGDAVFAAQKYIDLHFAQNLSLGELSQKFYVSSSYLSHAFRDWTGLSPKQYIMLSRISCAKELLVSEGLPVAETAARCGFGDVSNFIRSFKSETGVTPNTYRKHPL